MAHKNSGHCRRQAQLLKTEIRPKDREWKPQGARMLMGAFGKSKATTIKHHYHRISLCVFYSTCIHYRENDDEEDPTTQPLHHSRRRDGKQATAAYQQRQHVLSSDCRPREAETHDDVSMEPGGHDKSSHPNIARTAIVTGD